MSTDTIASLMRNARTLLKCGWVVQAYDCCLRAEQLGASLYDAPQHADCVAGNVARDGVFDIYSGDRYVAWRQHVMGYEPKTAPCDTCSVRADVQMPGDWDSLIRQSIDAATAAACRLSACLSAIRIDNLSA
jgi:hypothetical protein